MGYENGNDNNFAARFMYHTVARIKGGGARVRKAIWATSGAAVAATAELLRPADYTTWTDADYLYVSFWAMVYNHTSTQVRPWVNIDNPTYPSSGLYHGPCYNAGLTKCILYSGQRDSGFHNDYWDDTPTTVMGDAGDGTGQWDHLTWHHFCFSHSWNGSLWVDGKRTWYNSNQGEATWSVAPDTNNGAQNLFLRIGGSARSGSWQPLSDHFGVSNLSIWDPDGQDLSEFDDVEAIDPTDGAQDRFAAWCMNNPVDNTKSGLLWGWPMQADLNDVGPHGKHLSLGAGTHALNNGTYNGPVF